MSPHDGEERALDEVSLWRLILFIFILLLLFFSPSGLPQGCNHWQPDRTAFFNPFQRRPERRQATLAIASGGQQIGLHHHLGEKEMIIGGSSLKSILFAIACLSFFVGSTLLAQEGNNALYLDPNLPPERRAADLVSRMTLEEKVLQMQSGALAISRLGVPAYNWWNEALHGVAQGRATVFPQAIGLAATWDTELMHRVADASSALNFLAIEALIQISTC